MVDAIGENTIQMFTHLMQWFTGSNPVLTTKNKIKDMKKIYWFFWWLYNCPEIVWLKIKSYFKN